MSPGPWLTRLGVIVLDYPWGLQEETLLMHPTDLRAPGPFKVCLHATRRNIRDTGGNKVVLNKVVPEQAVSVGLGHLVWTTVVLMTECIYVL